MRETLVFLWTCKTTTNLTLRTLSFKLVIFLQHHKHNILLSVLFSDILDAFSKLKMLRCSHITDCNNILKTWLINLDWNNTFPKLTVRRTSDSAKTFLEHLKVQILKILALDTMVPPRVDRSFDVTPPTPNLEP